MGRKLKLKLKLSTKIFLLILSLTMVSGTVIYLCVLVFLPKVYSDQSNELFNQALSTLQYAINVDDIESNEGLLEDFSNAFRVSVSINDSNNNTLLEKNNVPENNLKFLPQSAIGIGVSLTDEYMLSTTVGHYSVDLVQLILIEMLPIVLSGILFVSLIGAFFCSRFIVKPIVGISKIAHKMSDLDFTLRCDTKRNDEIGILSESLNSLADNLKNTLEEVQSKNIILEAQIKIDRQREEERNYLFSAISHELKTPLTLLSCNLDGMIYKIGKYTDRDKYLEDSKLVIKQIDELVKEILTITKLEGVDYSLLTEDTNIGSLLSPLSMLFETLAVEKSIHYTYRISEGVIRRVNPSLMKKVISNILGNAIAYTPIGGTIAIFLYADGILKIENTGMTISEKELEEVFKPFYRIEKSRNRNTGGSGLGLYIVDRVLTIHDIPYQFLSKDNSNTFLIEF